MKAIAVLRDSDVGSRAPTPPTYSIRRAARAVAYDHDGAIALQYSTVKKYHKLPGGGIDDGESVVDALKRECAEELGCTVEVLHELGVVEEWRNSSAKHQTSYAYAVRIVGDKGQPTLTDSEVAEGFIVRWYSPNEALRILESELDNPYDTARFMTHRDLAIIRASQMIG